MSDHRDMDERPDERTSAGHKTEDPDKAGHPRNQQINPTHTTPQPLITELDEGPDSDKRQRRASNAASLACMGSERCGLGRWSGGVGFGVSVLGECAAEGFHDAGIELCAGGGAQFG